MAIKIVTKKTRSSSNSCLWLALTIVSAAFLYCYSFSCLKVYSSLFLALAPPPPPPLDVTNKDCQRLHQDFFDDSEWTEAIQQNVEFHDMGGNLESVQNLKDSAIDKTVEALGLTFRLNNNNDGDDEKNTTTHDGQLNKPPPVVAVTKMLQEHYAKHPDPRGGYLNPLPGKWSNENSKALYKRFYRNWFDVIEPFSHERFTAGLGPIGPGCKNLMKLGRVGYQKLLCPPKDPNSTLFQSDNNCHIISVGSSDEWSFEIDVVKTFGCTTHTFDCTLPGGGVPQNKPDEPKMHFYNHCIGSKTHTDEEGRSYLTYADMLHTAGIHTAPSYFKIDVEGFEFDIFRQMIHETTTLLPTQIAVELHWSTHMVAIPWMLRTRSSGELALFASMMFHAQYVPINVFPGKLCPQCTEVLYLRSPPCD